MVLKIYISGMSGNKEVKKRQQRVLMILESKNIQYEVVDITEPGREADKEFMQNKSTSNGATVSDPEPRHALPPQIFNEEEYCGDYDAFDLANEIDTLEEFLKVAPPIEVASNAQQENGDATETNGKGDENKENEGEKISGDNLVKDAEENAETKHLDKLSALRNAAAQVVIIMKVSLKFLKNAEKVENLEDTDAKKNDNPEGGNNSATDSVGNTKIDEDDNEIKDKLGNDNKSAIENETTTKVDHNGEGTERNKHSEEIKIDNNKKHEKGKKYEENEGCAESKNVNKQEEDDDHEYKNRIYESNENCLNNDITKQDQNDKSENNNNEMETKSSNYKKSEELTNKMLEEEIMGDAKENIASKINDAVESENDLRDEDKELDESDIQESTKEVKELVKRKADGTESDTILVNISSEEEYSVDVDIDVAKSDKESELPSKLNLEEYTTLSKGDEESHDCKES